MDLVKCCKLCLTQHFKTHSFCIYQFIYLFFFDLFRADVGNRITELSKVVGQLHGEMKDIHQTLLHIEEKRQDPSGQSTSSVIGKYIQGAKNNFRDFSSAVPSESKSAPLLANIHNPNYEVGNVNKEEVNNTAETAEKGTIEEEEQDNDNDQNGDEGVIEEDGAGDEIGEEESNDQIMVEDETMKMEEGRANKGKEESLSGSSGSQDTGFGSQESEFSASSPE